MSLTLPAGNALVTGAASGIGRAVAHGYAKAGVAGLYACDINLDGLSITAEECRKVATNPNFRIIAAKVDVRDEEDVIAMVNAAVKEFGRLDYAANVAGVGDIPKPTATHSLEEWDRVQAVNVRGVFLCMREELRAMLKNELVSLIPDRPATRGSIVNMGSIGAQIVIPGMTGYVSSKHAVQGMTKAAAVSHGPDAIRLNTVNPGYIVTPLFTSTYPDLTPFETPAALKRMGQPEEISDLTIYLSSPFSSFMTGASVNCDGGKTLT